MIKFKAAKRALILELELLMDVVVDDENTVYETIHLEREELDNAVIDLIPSTQEIVCVTSFSVDDVIGFIIADKQNNNAYGIGFIDCDNQLKKWEV
ncbi:hypothetical protein [Ligilactobacillus animalis]|uniref:hypothetical protein n=1 Tax=Ligilactobacillus animalis TaxID=1605 RepID=UPI00021951BF|nr:hypothetical protein [Ligilactobacillus animalis]